MTDTRTKAPPGGGSIETLPSGRHRVRIWDPTRPGQRMPSPVFTSVAGGATVQYPTVTPPRGTPVGLARQVIEQVADGQLSEATLQALCDTVLDAPLVRRALALRTAPHGPDRPQEALKLACAVLASVMDASKTTDSADSADNA